MKKRFYFILLLLLFLPIKTYAANDISINCGKTKLNKNEEVNCTILVSNLNFIATDITGQIELGSNLSLVSSSYDSSVWTSLANSFTVADIDLIRQDISKMSSLTVATFKIKAGANASGTSSITFKNVAMGNDSYQSVNLGNKTLSISFTSNINTLSSLSVSDSELSFSSDKTNYSLTVDSSSVVINATPTHSGAKVSGTGKRNLNYGNNTINVVVTAEDGSTKTYVLNITREDNRSTNNNLKDLSISKGNIKFNKTTTTYDVNVDSDVDEITIKAETEDSKASFENGFGPRKVKLEYGQNKIEIKVKSEKGTVKVYTININRKDDRSTNNNLKDITLSNGKIDFDKKQTDYIVNVPFEVETLKVIAIAEDSKSEIEIVGEENLIIGENIFTIKVTAENGSVKEYKIKVIRDEKVIITNSNKINNIEVEGYELDFSPEVYSYIIKTNDTQLNIKVELSDNNSTYEIKGNEELKDGSIISIVVTDKEGNKSIYKITIEQDKKLDWKKILLIVLIAMIIIFVILLIILFKKRKEIKSEYNESNTSNSENKIE